MRCAIGMAQQHRMSLWNKGGAVISLPDQWCLTKDRGWIRVDDVASMIRTVAASNDMPMESFEEVFALVSSTVAGEAEMGGITEDEAQAMIQSIEGFFLKQ